MEIEIYSLLFGRSCKKKKEMIWSSKNLDELGSQKGLEKVSENCTMVRISKIGIYSINCKGSSNHFLLENFFFFSLLPVLCRKKSLPKEVEFHGPIFRHIISSPYSKISVFNFGKISGWVNDVTSIFYEWYFLYCFLKIWKRKVKFLGVLE